MIRRTLLFSLLLPLSALAQLEVFQFDGTTDTAVSSLVNVGPAAPGDTLVTRFHVRNIGAAAAVLQTVSLSGDNFTLTSAPTLPYTLAPYTGPASEVEIDVAFSPPSTGYYSAFLAVDSINLVLQGVSAASVDVLLAGSQTPLSAGAVVDFGSVALGATKTQGFVLSNSASASITVGSIAVSGSGFTGPIGLTTPVQIAAGQSASFQVSFTPQSGPPSQGTLTVDGRVFNLTGQGLTLTLQLFQFDGTTDTLVPSGTAVNVGTAAPGDTIKTRFHVRNTGAGPIVLEGPTLSGQFFAIEAEPSFPYTLSPYVGLTSEPEIDVDFSPTLVGPYSATLVLDTITVTLQGTAAPSAVVTVTGSTIPLAYGATVDFGSAAVGSTQTETFSLYNAANGTLSVNSVTVAGAGFSGPIGQTFPLQIDTGQSASFQVLFEPQAGTPYQGTLTVDGRTFKLAGQGLDPPLPGASIVFASTLGASAQQNSITIPLASASQVTGNGTLTMAFQSSVAGVTDDAAIQFLSGPFRVATVSVAIGATSATIGGLSAMAFQTGTTAGTITFTLTLNGATQQLSLTIPASPIILDSATAVGLLGSLNVAFSGFDNTYSASQLAFTFYDLTGKALPQGTINADAGGAFQQYFATTQAGGMFALLATFPVTGNSAEIGFVTVQIANSIGTTTTQQINVAPPPAPPTVSQI